MKDKWGGILGDFYYICDNYLEEEAQNYAYELYCQDILLEMEMEIELKEKSYERFFDKEK